MLDQQVQAVSEWMFGQYDGPAMQWAHHTVKQALNELGGVATLEKIAEHTELPVAMVGRLLTPISKGIPTCQPIPVKLKRHLCLS